MSTAHLMLLERMCIQRAIAAGRFDIENDKPGHLNAPVTKHLQAECEDLFDAAQLLLSTLGLDLFTLGTSSAEPVYRCTGAGSDARAQYTPEGMTVLAGSKARAEVAPNFASKPAFQTRKKLIESGILKLDGTHLLFTENFTFTTPSAAATMVVGNNVNGWEAWLTEDGKDLDEMIRKVVNPLGEGK